ncbi:unnamed protein product, partial [marine sediment metagenome]
MRPGIAGRSLFNVAGPYHKTIALVGGMCYNVPVPRHYLIVP